MATTSRAACWLELRASGRRQRIARRSARTAACCANVALRARSPRALTSWQRGRHLSGRCGVRSDPGRAVGGAAHLGVRSRRRRRHRDLRRHRRTALPRCGAARWAPLVHEPGARCIPRLVRPRNAAAVARRPRAARRAAHRSARAGATAGALFTQRESSAKRGGDGGHSLHRASSRWGCCCRRTPRGGPTFYPLSGATGWSPRESGRTRGRRVPPASPGSSTPSTASSSSTRAEASARRRPLTLMRRRDALNSVIRLSGDGGHPGAQVWPRLKPRAVRASPPCALTSTPKPAPPPPPTQRPPRRPLRLATCRPCSATACGCR